MPIDGVGAGNAAGQDERADRVKPAELAEPAGDGPLGADIGQPPSLLLVDSVTRHRGEDLLEVLAAPALGQLPGLALLHQPAHIDDREALTVAFGLRHAVGGEEDRRSGVLSQPLQPLPHHSPRGWIQPHRGLVQEQHSGLVQQRGGDLQATQHAARQGPREPVEHRLKLHRGDRPLDPLLALVAWDASHARVEVEILAGSQRPVDRDRLGDVADRPAHSERLVAHVEAGDERASGARREQRREHADRRGLARAVGTEQGEHLAWRNGEGDASHGRELAEANDKIVHQHRRCGARRVHGRDPSLDLIEGGGNVPAA